ncbi:CubicO group peptidase (beta-lactamase class C family) [Chryseobacterium sp. 52]|uniref:serine hydrolase domain-containing protein n=1 Tax=Chryseobacterium sp. 52 TaxID=2035213 RepID=UPI000C1A3631|nr:serine hydrolase domain-containing protein [Chryseobacterium sp. 52]PIF44584.1 CubicO group peptidase (beta-lactamase class C family) [Chryseobacterium sp. 52]
MKKISLLALSVYSVFCLAQQSLKEKINLQSIVDNAAQKMVEKPLINAVSIGIVYQGQEYIGHYGELEKGKANLPTDQTIYEIGSLSKTFTGTLVAKAVLDKKLRLEDPVQKYLSEDYPNLKFNNHPVLIKDLVTHTSGLPSMLPLPINQFFKDFTNKKTPENINNALKNYTQKDFLRDLHTIKIDTIPGYKFSYSNAGIELLSAVLEKVYQKKFEVILKEYLAQHIQMKNTTITLTKKEEENLAVGYHYNYNDITIKMPALSWGSSGNIKSTLPDMMKYLTYQLKDNPEIAESHQPLVKVNETFSSGYAWRVIKDEKLGLYYKHHGGVFRAQCFISIIPKYNLGVFIITNQSGTNTAKDMQDTLNEIFEKLSVL